MKRRTIVPFLHRQSGSTFVVVIGFVAVVSMLFSVVLSRTMNAQKTVSNTSSWQEALQAAEAGSELAMAELRRTLADSNAFSGWEKLNASGVSQGTVPAASGKTILKAIADNGLTLRYIPANLVHAGEGNRELQMQITIDAPPQLIDPTKRQWFRVRSTGTTFLPGTASIAGDKRDLRLRQVSLRNNPQTNTAVTRPQTSRSIELIVKPIGLEPANFYRQPIEMNKANIVVNSYDSRDPDMSTNGLYDPAKAGAEGDIATNSTLIDAGNAQIYGDAYTNKGTVIDAANVHGEIDNDYYLKVASVLVTDWPLQPAIDTYQTVAMGGGTTVVAGSSTNPKRYRLQGNGTLNITGGDIIFAADPIEKAAGRDSYVDVWVTGDMKTAGTGGIQVQPGVWVNIYVEGSIYIGGNGNWNANSQPGRLQVHGVKYTGTGQQPAVTIAGNGIIVAAIYTPDHPVEFKATGSGGQMWGSIFGKSIIMGGSTHIHYDRALAEIAKITDFRVKSWFEITKD